MNKMAESLYGTSHTGLEFPLGELRIEDQSLLTLDVLTANIKGDVGDATVEKQKNILDYFFHEHQPDLILIQESLWTASNIKNNLTSIRASYETTEIGAGKRETVLFRVTNSSKLSFEMNCLFNPELESKKLSDYYQTIRDRATISSFTAKGRASGTPKTDLFTISWHGQNKCPTPSRSSLDTPTYKINVLRELLGVVRRLNYDSKGHRVPVILGGDFNIDYNNELVKGLISERGLQSIAPPMPPFRQGNRLLDFFIVTSDVTVDGVYAIPYELDPDGNVFNHVPVLARLTLPLTVTKVRR